MMQFLINTRAIINDKTLSLFRAFTITRASISTSFARTQQQTTNEDRDAPIDLANPFLKERKVCILCKHKITPNWKNVRLLSQFQSRFTGRIYGRHITGLCKKKQLKVEREILKAQSAGLMPFYNKEIKYVNDPKLFDVDNPFRPHKY